MSASKDILFAKKFFQKIMIWGLVKKSFWVVSELCVGSIKSRAKSLKKTCERKK